ncbi:MAG TPA: electron transfer flavoprotein subunit alpha [Candidatus Omnitrophota bacterium]|nr:electron transfer flavoprotein subunit alpha [Candidatus Omnitrophota bacterium]HPS36960.1 electron transfer flavoprotein subunit alpha [Candidatus Omnitrophota bacterium]
MEKILYLAHTQQDGSLPRIALEVLAAAQKLSKDLAGSTLVAGLVGGNIQAAADQIAGCGAAKVLGVSGADFNESRYATDVKAAEAIAKAAGATIVIAPATSRFARALPGLAFRMKGVIDTHVSGIALNGAQLDIQRWYYRQRMVATLTRVARPWILLVDSGICPAYAGAKGSAKVEAVPVTLTDSDKRTRMTGVQAPSADAQTIRPDAELLFVAGAGWTKKQADGQTHPKDAEKHILDFLKVSKASLGSSKSLVDLGAEGEAVLSFISHLNQVGQTGSTPRHPKGLATCCHGEEPHVVGWRFINERRAVNTDANCGWAQGKADVLYVADAFAVTAKVNELLAKG